MRLPKPPAKIHLVDNRRSIALGIMLLSATAIAWIGVITGDMAMPAQISMEMPMDMPMQGSPRGWTGAAAFGFTVQWGVMMVAMMLPSAAPMIMLYGAISRREGNTGRVIPAELFAAIYVALWH